MYAITFVLVCLTAFATTAHAQEIETETARLLPQGGIKGGGGVEYQTSSDGKELATPAFVEGGITDRLELVVEPVAYTSIRPATGVSATGVGDLEVTLVGLALHESEHAPALAFAGEIKVPTARNTLIGTKQVDYAGYVILSKRFGNVDLHLNGSYTVIGPPPNITVHNVFGIAVAAKYYVNRFDVFAEFLANTAATSESEMGATAEISGSEVVGTIGGGYKITPWALLSLGVSLDNNVAVLIHPGITLMHQLF